jgi:hypothetical protein
MTETGPQNWLYIASGILFVLPCFLLGFAWRSFFQEEPRPALSTWRMYSVKAALLVAVASTLLHMAWNASWLHCGGSPHGMGAGPGIWQRLGSPLVWTFAIASVMSIFGKGKGRILLLAWSVSMYFVFEAIYVLQME